jgi:AraC-like DNA-binding protein
MTEGSRNHARAILRRGRTPELFAISRRAPSRDLAAVADYLWVLDWDLGDRGPHRQQVLTDPAVNMTFTTGGRARIVGVTRGVFTETIEGAGRVVGVRFRPGGFRPLLGGPVSAITDRMVPVEEIFGPGARTAADAIIAAAEPDGAVALVEEFVRSRVPAQPDPLVGEVAAIVDRMAIDPALSRVDMLAAELGIGMRRLQRLFAEYIGVGPKWVIRRFRMQEAADRASDGTRVDWALLAAELGYADQAHFVRDFSATIGVSPAQYAHDCANDRRPGGQGIAPRRTGGLT